MEAMSVPAIPQDFASTGRKSTEERKELVARTVTGQIAGGAVDVESQSDFQAVLVRGKAVNHVLHLILTLVTFGMSGLRVDRRSGLRRREAVDGLGRRVRERGGPEGLVRTAYPLSGWWSVAAIAARRHPFGQGLSRRGPRHARSDVAARASPIVSSADCSGPAFSPSGFSDGDGSLDLPWLLLRARGDHRVVRPSPRHGQCRSAADHRRVRDRCRGRPRGAVCSRPREADREQRLDRPHGREFAAGPVRRVRRARRRKLLRELR